MPNKQEALNRSIVWALFKITKNPATQCTKFNRKLFRMDANSDRAELTRTSRSQSTVLPQYNVQSTRGSSAAKTWRKKTLFFKIYVSLLLVFTGTINTLLTK